LVSIRRGGAESEPVTREIESSSKNSAEAAMEIAAFLFDGKRKVIANPSDRAG
jgi:hypothetical protein